MSQYPPAFPALAAPFLALLGPAGLRVPAALGTAACAALFVLWTAPVLGWRRASFGGLALGVATRRAWRARETATAVGGGR